MNAVACTGGKNSDLAPKDDPDQNGHFDSEQTEDKKYKRAVGLLLNTIFEQLPLMQNLKVFGLYNLQASLLSPELTGKMCDGIYSCSASFALEGIIIRGVKLADSQVQ